jgi:hypothetical protein
MSRWMINCRQYSELISKSMDCRLSLKERILIRIHGWICPPCDYFRKQLITMRQACRWTPEETDAGEDQRAPILSDEVCERIQSRLDQLLKPRP